MKRFETLVFSLLGVLLIAAGAMLFIANHKEQAAKTAASLEQASGEEGDVTADDGSADTSSDTVDGTSEPSEDQ